MPIKSLSGDQGFRWEIRCWSRWTSSEQRSWWFANNYCIRMKVKGNTENKETKKITPNYIASLSCPFLTYHMAPVVWVTWFVGIRTTLRGSLASLGSSIMKYMPTGLPGQQEALGAVTLASQEEPVQPLEDHLGGDHHRMYGVQMSVHIMSRFIIFQIQPYSHLMI